MSVAPPESKIVLGPQWAGTRMTPEEFDAIEQYDECFRYELMHGVLVVSPLPSEAEVDPNQELGRLLRNYQETHPKGNALDSTLPERYIRTHDSRRRTDRVIWCGLGRQPAPRVDLPKIVVEFVSSGKSDQHRDYVEKRREYREVGVVEYWVFDRFRRTMTVFANQGGRQTRRTFSEGDSYQPALLPGFELPLARLFTIADRWHREGQ